MSTSGSGPAVLLEEPMIASGAYGPEPCAYARVDGAGHWMQLDRPDAVNQLLLDFLTRSPARV